MDIQMPGMDGYQTTAHIRKNETGHATRLPIIAMTAHALEGDREKSLQAGLDDYVTKPVDVSKLVSALLLLIPKRPVGGVSNDQVKRNLSVLSLNHTALIAGMAELGLPIDCESINVNEALIRIGGNKKLYKRLLLLFNSDHSRDCAAIRIAIQENDLELARRLAHTLKGVAGTIGANDLRSAAKNLETELAIGDLSNMEFLLSDLDQKLAIVVAVITESEQKAS